MLINDPRNSRSGRRGKLDPKMFKGRAMTYYGRWTYKYEIAAAERCGRRDHHSRDRSRPPIRFPSCQSSWGTENFEIDAANKNIGPVLGARVDHARFLEEIARGERPGFRRAEESRDEQRFRPVSLGANANIHIAQTSARRCSRAMSSARSKAAIRSCKDE